MPLAAATGAHGTSAEGGSLCTTEGVAQLYAMVDEAHHAGAFARVFPPAGARGCGQYCHFFERGLATASPQLVSEEDRFLWAFLRAHGALMPRRARLPPQKEKAAKHK